MLAEVGHIVVGLALTTALYAAFAAIWGLRHADARWISSSRNAVYATAGLLGLALVLLLVAFLGDQFQIRYVAQHSSRDLPLYLKVSALWAGQEGSLLLWSFLQALLTALVIVRPAGRSRLLVPWVIVFLSLIAAFFAGITLLFSNPFALQSIVPLDGQGLNPLLRHPGMVFHPPALYLGYVSLAVPFAFALAALVTGRVDDWPAAAHRWTLAAWLCLGLGLLLGARWAYDVLGWGGYWGWDPVENAGLMPWLTATALLHGLVMQEQRGSFRVWNVILAALSFALVLFGTFTTRSGMIASVHAFARSALGYYFLAFIGLVLVAATGLMIWRRQTLAGPRVTDGLLSREGTFFLTIVLFLTITATVLIGSVLPTLTEALARQRLEAGPDWFDRVTGPQFAALVLLMGVCPLLGRSVQALRTLRTRGLPALLGAVAVTIAAALAGFTQPISLAGFAIIGLAGATTLAEYAWEVIARTRQGRAHVLLALWRLFEHNRRKCGGYLVHAGVILMALGVVGTRMYPFETELVLAAGDQIQGVGQYDLLLEELRQETVADHLSTWATLSVYRQGDYLTTLRPGMDQYPDSDMTVSLPALRAGVKEDLYLVLAGWEESGSTATFKVHINPLASFLWLGGLVLLAGGGIALWPPKRAARVPVTRAQRRTIGASVGLAVGLLVLIAAGVAMWGNGMGARARATGRPLAGQPAPGFTVRLLDGSTLTLSDLRGRVVVINFWATWCPPCEDELPALQAVGEAYGPRGVVVVGIAFQDEETDVREMMTRFGIAYPVGMDVGERISSDYGITGVPETFIVDPEGRVASLHIGPVSAEQLRGELDRLLQGR